MFELKDYAGGSYFCSLSKFGENKCFLRSPVRFAFGSVLY